MQPNIPPVLNRLYLTSPLLELPPNILTYRLTDYKHKIKHGRVISFNHLNFVNILHKSFLRHRFLSEKDKILQNILSIYI